jgi:hypothetical protein
LTRLAASLFILPKLSVQGYDVIRWLIMANIRSGLRYNDSRRDKFTSQIPELLLSRPGHVFDLALGGAQRRAVSDRDGRSALRSSVKESEV